MTVYQYPCSDTSQCEPISVFLVKGIYRFECWGAQGGIGMKDTTFVTEGGHGAYTSGELKVKESRYFYLYIGGRGTNGNANKEIAKGGWNGGGNGGSDTRDDDGSAGGGGATDIRIISGSYNDAASLRSRIMVAAGGSGSAYLAYGAPGGDLNGYYMTNLEKTSYAIDSRVNQIAGNALGVGQNGASYEAVPASGSGGGYYGGKSVAVDGGGTSYRSIAASGSSYVSGYEGCNSIDENGHTGSKNHPSNYVFKNAIMLSGYQNFNNTGNIIEQGHIGNGAVRITRIRPPPSCKRCYESNYFRLFLIVLLNSK